MRLYSGKVATIAQECVKELVAAGDIEADAPKEVEADVVAVLQQYLTAERDVNERTKDLLERTNRPNSEYARVRLQLAETSGIKVGDEMLDYLLDQVVNIFHHSSHVDEIFAADVDMRRKMARVFKRHLAIEADVDQEVRAQLKHMSEGSRTWDIEYARVLEIVKRKRGL